MVVWTHINLGTHHKPSLSVCARFPHRLPENQEHLVKPSPELAGLPKRCNESLPALLCITGQPAYAPEGQHLPRQRVCMCFKRIYQVLQDPQCKSSGRCCSAAKIRQARAAQMLQSLSLTRYWFWNATTPEKLKGQLLSKHDVNTSLFLLHASAGFSEAVTWPLTASTLQDTVFAG